VEVRASADDDWTRAEIVAAIGPELHVRTVDGDDARSPPYELRAPVVVRYAEGAPVEVEWESKWWPATVKAERLGVHLVHYDDYDDTWDEWVGEDRVRAREGKDNLAP
jgi:hypothetical protein